MRTLSVLLILLFPLSALAQDVPPDMAPEGAPAPEPAPAPAPAPPPPAGPVYTPPPPMYQQPDQDHRNGMTFEANLGLGWIRISADGDSDTSDLGLGGLNLGVGGWANRNLAITGRIAGVTLSDNGVRLTSGLLGVSAQYWFDGHFWAGGGLGIGVLAATADGDGESITGLGLDLRAGYTFSTATEHTFNVSLELTPTFLSENGASATVTGIAILLGYQHL